MLHIAPIRSTFVFAMICILAVMVPVTVSAYTQYTVNDDATNCGACHGDFRANSYTSLSDGEPWGNLHNLHRSTILSGDCDACHLAAGRFPVPLDESAGGDGLAAIGCMGCHGRDEDNVASNPSFPFGRGAGLRQHHTNAGVNACMGCHDDADPASYTPVGEETLPPYYASPGNGHDMIPTGPCNEDGSEDFAGAATGLDNDGDGIYDTDDPGCGISAVPGADSVVRLQQNHPNPFNPVTNIKYSLDRPGHVLLQVYSVSGELVRTLVNANHGQASTYEVSWDGKNDDGRPQASGIFFYRLETAGSVEMKKMVLVK